MSDPERSDPADWDLLRGFATEPNSDPEPSVERSEPRRWSAEEKVRIVRESFWPGERVSDVARRAEASLYGAASDGSLFSAAHA